MALQLQGWKFAADGKCTDIPQAISAKANAQVRGSTLCLICCAHLQLCKSIVAGTMLAYCFHVWLGPLACTVRSDKPLLYEIYACKSVSPIRAICTRDTLHMSRVPYPTLPYHGMYFQVQTCAKVAACAVQTKTTWCRLCQLFVLSHISPNPDKAVRHAACRHVRARAPAPPHGRRRCAVFTVA